MGETTLVKADKRLVKQAHELGANVKRVVDLALEDYIRRNECLKPEIKARKRPSRDCNGGTIEDNGVQERNLDNTNFSGSRRRRPGAWRPSGSTSVVDLP